MPHEANPAPTETSPAAKSKFAAQFDQTAPWMKKAIYVLILMVLAGCVALPAIARETKIPATTTSSPVPTASHTPPPTETPAPTKTPAPTRTPAPVPIPPAVKEFFANRAHSSWDPEGPDYGWRYTCLPLKDSFREISPVKFGDLDVFAILNCQFLDKTNQLQTVSFPAVTYNNTTKKWQLFFSQGELRPAYEQSKEVAINVARVILEANSFKGIFDYDTEIHQGFDTGYDGGNFRLASQAVPLISPKFWTTGIPSEANGFIKIPGSSYWFTIPMAGGF